jgi:hypothetical protein
MRRGLSATCVALATLSASIGAAHAVECRSEKGEGYPWAWRQIDGKRCWYRGKAGMDKKLLQWSASSGTPAATPRSAAAKSLSTKSSTAAKSSAATRSSANKNSRASARSPSLISGYAEHESLLYTYWPPLVPPADVSNERSDPARAKRM